MSKIHPATLAVDLLYSLGDDPGFEIGMDEIVRAQCLLARLATSGTMPEDLQRLCFLLAPVVCTTHGEQQEFYRRFEQAVIKPLESRVDADKDAVVTNARMTRDRRFMKAVVALSVPLIILAVWLPYHYFRVPESKGPDGPIVIDDSADAEDSEGTVAPIGSTQVTANAVPWDPKFDSSLRVVAGDLPPSETERMLRRGISIGTPVLVVPLLLWGLWRLRLRKASLYLQREQAETPPEVLASISSRSSDVDLFRRPEVKRATIHLRKRFSVVTKRLDVAKTISRTIRSGGQFSPVLASRPMAPEYVALVERRSRGDHLAHLAMTFVSRLVDDEVHIDSFEFAGTPSQCFSWPASRRVTLDQIANRYAGKRLVVCGPAACFYDRITGLPAAWTEALETWPERVLLSTTPVTEWGYQEWFLAQSGMVVLPLSPLGISAIMSGLESGPGRYPVPVEWSPRLPQALADSEDLWLSRKTPPESVQSDLLDALDVYLGSRGMLWLSACAVYPEINWKLTLRLGRALAPDLCTESDVSSVSRLPCFRSAWMPDWLRTQLISRLTPEQEQEIRFAIDSMLLGAETTDSSDDSAVQIAWDNRSLLSAVSDRWFRRFRAASPQHPAAKDYVFARFMQTESIPRLAYQLPARTSAYLRRQLYDQSRAIRFLFPLGRWMVWLLKWPALIAGALAIAVGISMFLGVGDPSQRLPTPVTAPSSGYTGELTAVIDQSVRDLEAGRTEEFLKNMIPRNELGYVLAIDNLELLVRLMDDGPESIGMPPPMPSQPEPDDARAQMRRRGLTEVALMQDKLDTNAGQTPLQRLPMTPRIRMLADLKAVQSFLRTGGQPEYQKQRNVASFRIVRPSEVQDASDSQNNKVATLPQNIVVTVRFELEGGSWRLFNGAEQIRRVQSGVVRGDFKGRE